MTACPDLQAHPRSSARTASSRITIDRPAGAQRAAPGRALRARRGRSTCLRGDPALRVAIVTGAGDRAFCVGTDLKSLAQTGPYEYPPRRLRRHHDALRPVEAGDRGGQRPALGGGVRDSSPPATSRSPRSTRSSGCPSRAWASRRWAAARCSGSRGDLPMKDAMGLVLTGASASPPPRRGASAWSTRSCRAARRSIARRRSRARSPVRAAGVEASKQVMLQSLAEPDLAAAMRRELSRRRSGCSRARTRRKARARSPRSASRAGSGR